MRGIGAFRIGITGLFVMAVTAYAGQVCAATAGVIEKKTSLESVKSDLEEGLAIGASLHRAQDARLDVRAGDQRLK